MVGNITAYGLTGLSLLENTLKANREDSSLNVLRELGRKNLKEYTLKNGLLFQKGLLVVPSTANIRTELIREAHDQI